jgi:transposase
MNQEDIIRIQQFNQFKKEIRGNEDYLIIGIDVGKDKHHAFMGTATGRTLLRRLIFENNLDGFRKLLVQTEAVQVQNGLKSSVFGMEPTGNYHKPLGSFLIGQNRQVVLASGVAVRRNRELLDGRWDKHDSKDAANVADLISQGKSLFYEYSSADIVELRTLLSFRKRLKKEEHSLNMRIRNNLLAKHFPEMDRFYGQCGHEGLAIVNWCLDPQKICGMEFRHFFSMVTRREKGLAQQRRLRAIWEAAFKSVGCAVDGASEFEAQVLVEKILQVRKDIKATNVFIERVGNRFSHYRLLQTIPGFGPYVSAMVLAIISDPWRFENQSQVLKLAGYDLSAVRSGKSSQEAVPVISKKGNANLRYALYQAAFIASVRNLDFLKYYTNMLRGREGERGIKTKMRVKLAAKMLVIAWTLMKKKESFNPDYLNIE